jgi:hypothetical protein
MDSHRSPTVRYEDLEPRLRTGDVFLFHGASRRSRIIEAVTESEFSHIGMIVRPGAGKPPLLWHTDPRAVTEDVEDDGEHGGAQLNDLAAALAVMTSPGYGDTPFVRQLLVERTPEMDEIVLQAIAAEDSVPFPSLVKLIKEWMLGWLHIATSEERMDCAAALALTYQRMGLLAPEPPPNAYSPRDFSAQHMTLRLLRGATLGPQLEVLRSGTGSSAAGTVRATTAEET